MNNKESTIQALWRLFGDYQVAYVNVDLDKDVLPETSEILASFKEKYKEFNFPGYVWDFKELLEIEASRLSKIYWNLPIDEAFHKEHGKVYCEMYNTFRDAVGDITKNFSSS